MLDSIKFKLSSINLYRVWLSFLGFLVAVFFLFFVYTISLFFAVRKLPLTAFGIGIFRGPLVSNSLTGLFYKNVTSKFLLLFYDSSLVESIYPTDLVPVGKIYSGNYLYTGVAKVCDLDTSLSVGTFRKMCLELNSGRKITPYCINGISNLIGQPKFNPEDLALEKVLVSDKPYQVTLSDPFSLPKDTKVRFLLEGDASPDFLLKEKMDTGELTVREVEVLKE